jgi:serine O-acetyltransferase
MISVVVKLLGGFWVLRNRTNNTRNRIIKRVLKMLYTQYLQSLGAYIGLATQIDGTIDFPHKQMGIFIAPGAKIGSGCIIYQQVTIGENNTIGSKGFGSPRIGDNVYIGAGAKIIGNVRVGHGARIGANATVVRDVPAGATVVSPAGVFIQPK